MVRYAIHFKPAAAQQLRKLDRPVQVRLSSAIDALASVPRPQGCEKLKGEEGLLRIRVGDYRVLYQILDDRLLISVVRVGHRREVYRKI